MYQTKDAKKWPFILNITEDQEPFLQLIACKLVF